MTNDQMNTIVSKYPRLNFLKSPEFMALPREKKEFLFQCVEDALFWVEVENTPHGEDGFQSLALAYSQMV